MKNVLFLFRTDYRSVKHVNFFKKNTLSIDSSNKICIIYFFQFTFQTMFRSLQSIVNNVLIRIYSL